MVRIHSIELDSLRETRTIRGDANLARIASMQYALDESLRFYREPWFVATLTALVLTASAVASLFIYRELTTSLQVAR